jgi:hypothetical protein
VGCDDKWIKEAGATTAKIANGNCKNTVKKQENARIQPFQ